MAASPLIFLDGHSTTRVDPRVCAAMQPWLTNLCGNPSSPHAAGTDATGALDAARAKVADLVGADAEEVVFTATATEANNLALWGLLYLRADQREEQARRTRRKLTPDLRRPRVVVSAMEHKSVLEVAMAACKRLGLDCVILPVDTFGRVKDDEARKQIIPGLTWLVSVQLANNEVGTVQDVARMAALAHAAGAVYHCDATQGLGRIPFSMRLTGADIVTCASHKIHGPKGAAAMVVRRGLEIVPLMQGGKQERGLRPGTENVPALIGFGEACRIYTEESASEAMRVYALRDRLATRLGRGIDNMGVLGPFRVDAQGQPQWPDRTPNNLSIHIDGVKGKDVVLGLKSQVCLSTGSACNCPNTRSTDVLRAMGIPDANGEQVVRMGLGRFTTEAEVDEAADKIIETVRRLRRTARAA